MATEVAKSKVRVTYLNIGKVGLKISDFGGLDFFTHVTRGKNDCQFSQSSEIILLIILV